MTHNGNYSQSVNYCNGVSKKDQLDE